MFLTRSEYDRGVNTFSPEGRLFQVEYAIEAIKLGTTALGIRTNEGVVLAVEKRITSPLLDPSSVEKTFKIDSHVGAAVSGITADARTLIDHARVVCQNHTFTYEEKMPIEAIAQSLCDKALSFGEDEDSDISRPFGVSLILGGIDNGNVVLYVTDPSGTFIKYQAHAIGSGAEGAQSRLQEDYNSSMSLKDAEKLSLSILKQVMEEKISKTNVELATITPGEGYKLEPIEIVDSIIQSLN